MTMAEQEKYEEKISKIPNEYYKKFFEKFKEIETLEVKQWRAVHILAFFCKKYKEKYNVEYQFKFNVPQPSRSYELFRINSLGSNLSSDPIILKQYIEWVFAEKTKSLKKRFTAISFLNKEEFLTEYKYNFFNKTNSTINRSQTLPEEFLSVLGSEHSNIKTYGDLAFYNKAYQNGGFPPLVVEQWNNLIKKIETLGLDLELLNKLS